MQTMRNSRMTCIALVTGLFLAMSSWAEAKPPKWEYLVVSAALNNRSLEQVLNARGAEGWELVAFTRKDVAIFKRTRR